MDGDAIAQLVTVVVAVLAIIWHQQRSIDKLRDDFNTANRELREDLNAAGREQRGANDKLRDDFNTANREFRDEFNAANREQREATGKIRDGVAANGQRLARIEGRLVIGVPAAPAEPDAGVVPALPADAEGSPPNILSG